MFASLAGSFGITGARLLGAGAGFVTQLLLARMMPPADLGLFYAAMSLAAVVGLIVTQGYAGIVQRFTSRYLARRRSDLRTAFHGQVVRDVFLTAIGAALAIGLCVGLWPTLPTATRIIFISGAVCIVPGAAFNIYTPFVNAQRRFAVAYLPETLARPVLFLLAVTAIALLSGVVTGPMAAVIYTALSCVLALSVWPLIRSRLADEPHAAVRSRIRQRWRREGRLLVIVALFTNSFADLAILAASAFLSSAELAHFGVAIKIAMLVGFAVQVSQQISLPDLADSYERRDGISERSAILRSTAFPTMVTFAALVGAALAGDRVLSLFGPSFTESHWALVAMMSAQFMRALLGPGSQALSLKGEQVTNAGACVAAVTALIVGDLLLIRPFGLAGAGLAVLGAVLTWTVAASGALWLQHRIRVDLLAVLRLARRAS